MRYYKVQKSYNQEDFIPIDEMELEKALYAFVTGKPVVFNEGAANRIEGIVPDWNRAMGWNYGYRLTSEDYADIRKIEPEYKGYLAEVREKVNHLIQSGQTHLIGKNENIKALA